MAFVSFACRLNAEEVSRIVAAKLDKPGFNSVPEDVIPPRQIMVIPEKTGNIACTLKFHRDGMVTVIPRNIATELVRDKVASWVPQSVLVYTMDQYVNDKDVLANQEELNKAMSAMALGEQSVIVAMVGLNRSTRSVCRNIVSGCQDPEKLREEAKMALNQENVFLVE